MAKVIEKCGPYVERDARLLFSQIVAAIEYLHSMDIAHRDIKPENVLLTHRNEVKVADFGLSNFCRDSTSNERLLLLTRCGTRMFMPPEVLSSNHGYNAIFFDIWSMGETLSFLVFTVIGSYTIILIIGENRKICFSKYYLNSNSARL